MITTKPTVTELLDLLNKPQLMKWANKIGLEGIRLEDYLAKSASAGTNLHKQIENFLLHDTPFEDEKVNAAFAKFHSDKVVKEVEFDIETDYFIGRGDAKIIYKNQIYLCDFKSKDQIYLEQKLQLTAYRMADRFCKTAIVKIPEFTFKEVVIDYPVYENILIKLSELYTLLKQAK